MKTMTTRAAQHRAKMIEEAGLIDLCKCSCGWTSKAYYDGQEFAYAEWQKHAAKSEAEPH